MKGFIYSVFGLLAGMALGWFSAIYIVESDQPKYKVMVERHSPDGKKTFQILSGENNKKIIKIIIDGKIFVRYDAPFFHPSYHEPVVEIDWSDSGQIKLKIDNDFGENVDTYRFKFPSIVKIEKGK